MPVRKPHQTFLRNICLTIASLIFDLEKSASHKNAVERNPINHLVVIDVKIPKKCLGGTIIWFGLSEE